MAPFAPLGSATLSERSTMLKHRVLSVLAAIALPLAAIQGCGPEDAAQDTSNSANADTAVVLGPYATIRRANEVAAEYRSAGYNTLVYHNGDGYYVKVW
jgi:hypothetical protein